MKNEEIKSEVMVIWWGGLTKAECIEYARIGNTSTKDLTQKLWNRYNELQKKIIENMQQELTST